ncbi:MAG: hypothetical protein EON54_06655 [Alcaligenaceae bacterium]|nr:MAG: hypothetical protein EON54_06655 [Alcaligenaceae bacterium]
MTSSTPASLPDALKQLPGAWQCTGRGSLTWSVFRIYDASLYCADGSSYPDGRYALVLNYLRNLSADQIVAASVMEMQRLANPSDAELQTWTDELHRIMPDVTRGDTLIGVFDGTRGVRFFYNDQPSGEIASAGFAHAFASIWLSEGTRSPTLREALLGASGAHAVQQ